MKAHVMCGAPGSGKSTFSERLRKEGAVVISGDSIRAELYGDADIQGNWVEIHDRMVELLEENVGSDIVMDGTHYRAKYRKEALTLLQSYGYTDVSLVIVNPPLEVCLYQNSSRSRNVPEDVIAKMHKALQTSLRGVHDEGFSSVKFV